MDKIKYDYTAYLLHEQYGTHDTNYICSCGMRMDSFVGIVKEELLPWMLMFLGSKYFQTKYVEFFPEIGISRQFRPAEDSKVLPIRAGDRHPRPDERQAI